MDGAGRLARSARSLGPETDPKAADLKATALKAAAIGAVVLLREQLCHRPPRAQPMLDREPPHRWIALIERYLPARAGIAATVLMLLGSAAFGIVKGGHLEELSRAASDTRNAI